MPPKANASSPANLLQARSVSQTLPPVRESGQALRVLSAHRRALNLEDEQGRILAVVTPEAGDGPFHIVLTREIALNLAAPGAQAWREGTTLTLADWIVDWAQARRWHPGLTPATIPAQSLARLSDCVRANERFQERMTGIDGRSASRLQQGAIMVAAGAVTGDEEALQAGVALLMGLGPGLTPAGDDYLLGALARLHLDAAAPDVSALARYVAANAPRTTKLSRAWLLHGVQARFDARWHALQKAMSSGRAHDICRTARAILAVGATSGPLSMAGFLLRP
jgi:hypothetical protein